MQSGIFSRIGEAIMKDLIDRQAAIEMISKRLDALKLLHIGTSTFQDGIADGYARIRSDIKFLPSAQPEITLESAIDYLYSIGWMQEHDRIMVESAQPEIIRCKDCKNCGTKTISYGIQFLHCNLNKHSVSENAFCCWAERRTDGRSNQ